MLLAIFLAEEIVFSKLLFKNNKTNGNVTNKCIVYRVNARQTPFTFQHTGQLFFFEWSVLSVLVDDRANENDKKYYLHYPKKKDGLCPLVLKFSSCFFQSLPERDSLL